MSSGSIEAGIQFESYKIDKIDFSVVPKLGILSSTNHQNFGIHFNFGFRNAEKYLIKDKIQYVTGLQIQIVIVADGEKKIAEGTFSISGLFTTNNSLPPDKEKGLVKHQCPAILFPYLRAAISFILTSSGFSTIMMPLVNVYEAAKDADLEIIDCTDKVKS